MVTITTRQLEGRREGKYNYLSLSLFPLSVPSFSLHPSLYLLLGSEFNTHTAVHA
jgi:hypothetical protein